MKEKYSGSHYVTSMLMRKADRSAPVIRYLYLMKRIKKLCKNKQINRYLDNEHCSFHVTNMVNLYVICPSIYNIILHRHFMPFYFITITIRSIGGYVMADRQNYR